MDATTILLVEDDAMDAAMLRLSLERSRGNYAIKRVSRLSAGVEFAMTRDYDVIVTDLGLPDSQGLGAVEHLRRASPGGAIVVVSGQAEEDFYVDALTCGADAFLCKQDLGPVTLHRCIQQSITRCKQKAENNSLIQAIHEQKSRLESQAIQLADKNDRLERLCATSQEFVNNVSHEFRTPLCVIKQYASLIADGVVGPIAEEQTKMLRVIEGRVDDLNNMVDDMLDISRHESGLLAASRERSNAVEILHRILPGLSLRANLRQIDLQFEVPQSLPEIYCDPEKVSRTLINLIVNAIKFSSNGSIVCVSISHCPINLEVIFSVRDSGPGIDAQQRELIFARFQQVETTLQSSTKGFGLGLNIAKELVDLNLGAMSLKSTVGEGSTFSFSVPVDDSWEVCKRFTRRLQAIRGSKETRVLAVKARIAVKADARDWRETHGFLNFLLKSRDLLVPTGGNEWLIILSAESSEVEAFFAKAMKQVSQVNRNRPQGPLPELHLEFAAEFDLQAGADALRPLVTAGEPQVHQREEISRPFITRAKEQSVVQ